MFHDYNELIDRTVLLASFFLGTLIALGLSMIIDKIRERRED